MSMSKPIRKLLAVCILLAAASLAAQSDVSIKPGQKGYGIPRSLGIDPSLNLTVHNLNLRAMILYAFNLRAYQLDGGPDWMNSDTFDIRTPLTGANPDEARAGFQAFLTERFKLRFHRESRPMPVYALKVVQNGEGVSGVWIGVATPSDNGRTLARFASDLAGSLDRPVLDATNLAGKYDLMPNSTTFPIPAIVPPDIGLKLDSQDGAVEVLVIDSASKPETEN
jgi:hypothetical protein